MEHTFYRLTPTYLGAMWAQYKLNNTEASKNSYSKHKPFKSENADNGDKERL